MNSHQPLTHLEGFLAQLFCSTLKAAALARPPPHLHHPHTASGREPGNSHALVVSVNTDASEYSFNAHTTHTAVNVLPSPLCKIIQLLVLTAGQ